jgi:antirestriction protein ArdC
VFYADRFTPQKGKAQGCEQGTDAGEAIRSILKRFSVFNVAQCESLPERFETVLTPLPDREPQPQAEALIAATGADFRIGGAQAFYVTELDYVQVPPIWRRRLGKCRDGQFADIASGRMACGSRS